MIQVSKATEKMIEHGKKDNIIPLHKVYEIFDNTNITKILTQSLNTRKPVGI